MRGGLRLHAGLELSGRYRLDAPIGHGGMGEVWRGTDLRLRRQAAIKVLPAELAADEAGVARFRREAEVAAALQHPGITVVFDIDEHRGEGGEADGLVFLVMELLEGQDLRSLLTRHPRGLPVDQVVALAAQVAEALAAAHSRGIVHRDIKPANLFLLNDGRVKICDFGIAHLADATTRLTATGGSIGTPRYMAPEQFRGQTLDHRTDLYSLGCVIYELLTGVTPFNADTGPAALMYQHLGQAPESPAALRPDIPAAVDRLVLDLLAKDPNDRPQNASAVVAALHGPDAGPLMPRPTGAPATVPVMPGPGQATAVTHPAGSAETVVESPPRKSRRTLVTVLAAVVGVIVVTAGVFVLVNNSEDPKSDTKANAAPSSAPSRNSDPAPTIPGWQAVLAPGYGLAYDVPPDWKVEEPGTYIGIEDGAGEIVTGEKASAGIKQGKCTRVRAGIQGGRDPVPNPTEEVLLALKGTASQQAIIWGKGAYTSPSGRVPVVRTGQSRTLTLHGIKAGHVAANVTSKPTGDPCIPARAVVWTVAMAASKDADAYGPIVFTVYADRGVTPQVGDDVLKKVIGSIRPYECPLGLTSRDNVCSTPTASPTASASPS